LADRDVTRWPKEIASFHEVQEVHIISGELDILIKVKAKDVDSVCRYVVDNLQLAKGTEKTLTCLVFESERESIPLLIRFLLQLVSAVVAGPDSGK
jgi:DNA-binding Lrp family transcriptional regulator